MSKQATLPDWEHLSLEEQVAQLLVVRASGYLFDHQIPYPIWEPTADVLHYWVNQLGVGGVILLGGSAAEIGVRSHQLQEWANIPLLIAADIEEGVGQRFSGATWFPPPMALGAIASTDLEKALALTEAMGATTAQEALAIGINWVLAPVVDVNNNPLNPVINVRAFGETPDRVGQLATAFIRGAKGYPVLTTAKHFPGHGDTATDSHLELPVLPHSYERLRQVELLPFQAAIATGVDAVMSAHLHIPAVDPTYPATLSHRILTEELRHTLGFDGLIVTDALVMGAIANRYGANEAPLLALDAGADILLMPLDPEGAIATICEAVNTGRIPLNRIHASLNRIWRAKQTVYSPPIQGDSSHSWEIIPPLSLIDIHNLPSQLAQPEAIATATTILEHSMRVYHPTLSRMYPDDGTPNRRNLIVVDDALTCEFLEHHTPAIALPKAQGYRLQLVDCHTPTLPFPQQPDGELGWGACCASTPSQSNNPDAYNWHPTLLQVFIRGNPFRGSAGLTQTAQAWFHQLVASNQLKALVVYGSPYILEQFLPDLPPDVPYVFTYGQMAEAQAIALNALRGMLVINDTLKLADERLTDEPSRFC